MKDPKLKAGDEFYDSRLNNLLACRDKYYNSVYSEEGYKDHLTNEIKYFKPSFAEKYLNHKVINNYKRFKVIQAKYQSGGSAMGHPMPDIYRVECSPVEDNSIMISFCQDTFGYNSNMEDIEQIF